MARGRAMDRDEFIRRLKNIIEMIKKEDWGMGWDSKWRRWVGDCVPSICDEPSCDEEIDRGLSHVCGGDSFGGEYGCGLYFCEDHLVTTTVIDVSTWVDVCERCSKGEQPFEPKADTKQWRDENPEEVNKIKQSLRE